MKTRFSGWSVISALCLSLLVACGGGGGDAPASGAAGAAAPTNPNPNPVASNENFRLAAGYRAWLIAGSDDNFDITGSCSGTARIKIEPLAPATFETVTGFGSAQVSTPMLTNCIANTETGTTYYNANYSPIGLVVNNGEYAVFTAAPIDLPASVRVGDAGTIVTYNRYGGSGKSPLLGTRVVSYKIEPDTTTTAIFNLITTSSNTSGLVLSTQESRYKMSIDGTLTRLTIEVKFDNALLTRLVYTKK